MQPSRKPDSVALIIIASVLFLPLGLYFMVRSGYGKAAAAIVATLVVGITFVVATGGNQKSATSPASAETHPAKAAAGPTVQQQILRNVEKVFRHNGDRTDPWYRYLTEIDVKDHHVSLVFSGYPGGTPANLDRSRSVLTVQAASFCSCPLASSHVARTSRGVW